MDEQLAAIYGTNQVEEQDVEKLAAAELLVKLADEQGIDLDSLSDEQVGELVQDLYAGGEQAQEMAQEAAPVEGEEKLAEADFLGRVMAHAYVQEMKEIEKEAGIKDVVKKSYEGIKSFIKNRPVHYRAAGEHMTAAGKGKGVLTGKHGGKREFDLPALERLKEVGRAAKQVAPEAGVVAGSTVGVTAAKKISDKKKHGSALDTLAEERAYQMLEEAGYTQQEKVASELDQAVEVRALQILEANGYPVQWNE